MGDDAVDHHRQHVHGGAGFAFHQRDAAPGIEALFQNDAAAVRPEHQYAAEAAQHAKQRHAKKQPVLFSQIIADAAIEGLAPDAMRQHRAFGQRRRTGRVDDQRRTIGVGFERSGGRFDALHVRPIGNARKRYGLRIKTDEVPQIGQRGKLEMARALVLQFGTGGSQLAQEIAECAIAGRNQNAAARLGDLIEEFVAFQSRIEKHRDEAALRRRHPVPDEFGPVGHPQRHRIARAKA